MKILVLAPQPFYQLRGTPIAVRMLVETLAELGHEVDLLVFHEGEDLEMPGVSLHRSPAPPWVGNVGPGFSVKKLLCDAAMTMKAARMAWRGRYDMIHAVEEAVFMAWLAGRLTRTPYVFDMDSSMPEQIADKYRLPRWLHRLMDRFEAFAIRGSAGVVAVCRALEDRVRDQAPGTPVVRLEDVSLLDDKAETEEDLRHSLRLGGEVILYVGNLESYQGIDLLVESFALAAEQRDGFDLVVIGGTADDVARYGDRAANLGVAGRTHFIGPRPLEALAAYLRQADILVSPRIHGNNTPMKIYSYLDSGRPVLATRLPTHTQALTDEIAELVDPSAPAMAEGMLKLLGDSGERDRKAARARERVASEYSIGAFKRKLSAFYLRLGESGDEGPKEGIATGRPPAAPLKKTASP